MRCHQTAWHCTRRVCRLSLVMQPSDQHQVQFLFGKRLMALRKTRGWSQEHLAYECGLGRSYVGSVERGERNISLMNICVFARTLGVSPMSMLDFESQEISKPGELPERA